MKIILSHPTGNECSRAVAKGLLEADMLAAFYTSIASFPHSALDSLGSIRPLSEIKRRGFEPGLQLYTHTWPWREAGRLLSAKAGIKMFLNHETGIFSIDSVYKSIDQKVASDLKRLSKKGAKGIYAYEDAALYSFMAAKNLSVLCFYDLAIGYWRSARKLMQIEAEKWPDWTPTLTGLRDSESKLNRKDEEIKLADVIFVGSSFTAKTLEDYPGKLPPVKILPYGFPNVGGQKEYRSIYNRPLKLLFVGGLSQRKGVADLFEAVNHLKDKVELTVVGRKTGNYCPALDKELAKHKWIPSMPHHDILKIMREHDVLLFPSLFEGFGLVITEAMAQGTPVITTERTVGPDIIKEGENGWIICAGSSEKLQNAIEQLLLYPEWIAKAGREAMETARQRPWRVYSKELAQVIGDIK